MLPDLSFLRHIAKGYLFTALKCRSALWSGYEHAKKFAWFKETILTKGNYWTIS
jgi:hypothetical protein